MLGMNGCGTNQEKSEHQAKSLFLPSVIGAQRVATSSKIMVFHLDGVYTDQTGQVPRLIWVDRSAQLLSCRGFTSLGSKSDLTDL